MSSKKPEMKLPKISIVTPSYNQAAFIERTIQSVLNQNYPNLEYIIIDGGSTDGSVEIIRKYSDKLAYWVSEKDKGQTHAINKGFHRATGEIVAWLNSDDLYCPNALETVAKTFMANKKVDLVFGNTFLVDKDDAVLRDICNVPFWWPALIVTGVTLPQPSTFWKRSLFEKYGFLDENMCCEMDYEFFARIGQQIKARHIPIKLSCFRLHHKQKTETLLDIRATEIAAIRKRYMKKSFGICPPFLFKLTFLIHKTFWHLIRGEFRYIVRGFFRRSEMAIGKDRPILPMD